MSLAFCEAFLLTRYDASGTVKRYPQKPGKDL